MDLEGRLNEEQAAAVTHGEGPQLVLAGAGSGKTRVITYRIAWLIEERRIDPRSITAVTFTNKAASEMLSRVEEVVDRSPLESFVGTFHRFALILLRRYGERIGLKRGFMILDDADQLSLVKQALKDESLAETSFPARGMLSRISDAKSRLVSAESMTERADGFFEERLARVYARYGQLLRRASGVDFDDLIAGAVEVLKSDREVRSRVRWRCHYLLVDEFQDTNHAQLSLVRELAGADGNLTAVGDEDQGIYRWRGADLDNILHFENNFPGATLRKLERNYRSTQNILDASGALVEHNEKRRGKRLWTDSGAGEAIELFLGRDEIDEARWVVKQACDRVEKGARYGDIGFLVRTNGQTRALEEELLRTETPYSLVGGTRFYSRAEIKDLVAYLRVLHDPRDRVSMQRVLNQPPRGIGKATRQLLEDECEHQALSLWDLLVLDQLGSLPARALSAVRKFGELVEAMREEAEGKPIVEVLEIVLEKTDFLSLFQGGDPDSNARLENVRELLSAGHGFATTQRDGDVSLSAFLDHVALVTDLDDWEGEKGVSVMTMHSAKGLEFSVVFVLGLEEGLLPHYNSRGQPEDLEEERRLLYVGMTRAKDKLLLSSCRRRRVAGRYQDQRPSPFIEEIPEHLLTVEKSPNLFSMERTRGVSSFFGRESPEVDSDSAAGLQAGRKVRHPTLGLGVVLDSEGEGDGQKLTVFFDRSGKRKLVAKYANLEIVS
jgi:DNA helicase-2/ATP-dependent DNA helicase PcrA